MKLKVTRNWKKDTYTIGRLYVNGELFRNTLEDKDRGLKKTDALSTILKTKIPGETAIPSGIYEIDMDRISPKYAAIDWYKKNCNGGRMPHIKDVPGFDAVLIHSGTTALDSRACVLVGRNTATGMLTSSKDTLKKLYKMMLDAHKKGEKITIEIK